MVDTPRSDHYLDIMIKLISTFTVYILMFLSPSFVWSQSGSCNESLTPKNVTAFQFSNLPPSLAPSLEDTLKQLVVERIILGHSVHQAFDDASLLVELFPKAKTELQEILKSYADDSHNPMSPIGVFDPLKTQPFFESKLHLTKPPHVRLNHISDLISQFGLSEEIEYLESLTPQDLPGIVSKSKDSPLNSFKVERRDRERVYAFEDVALLTYLTQNAELKNKYLGMVAQFGRWQKIAEIAWKMSDDQTLYSVGRILIAQFLKNWTPNPTDNEFESLQIGISALSLTQGAFTQEAHELLYQTGIVLNQIQEPQWRRWNQETFLIPQLLRLSMPSVGRHLTEGTQFPRPESISTSKNHHERSQQSFQAMLKLFNSSESLRFSEEWLRQLELNPDPKRLQAWMMKVDHTHSFTKASIQFQMAATLENLNLNYQLLTAYLTQNPSISIQDFYQLLRNLSPKSFNSTEELADQFRQWSEKNGQTPTIKNTLSRLFAVPTPNRIRASQDNPISFVSGTRSEATDHYLQPKINYWLSQTRSSAPTTIWQVSTQIENDEYGDFRALILQSPQSALSLVQAQIENHQNPQKVLTLLWLLAKSNIYKTLHPK